MGFDAGSSHRVLNHNCGSSTKTARGFSLTVFYEIRRLEQRCPMIFFTMHSSTHLDDSAGLVMFFGKQLKRHLIFAEGLANHIPCTLKWITGAISLF
jgi:hypothetical protein